jgi:hypothetical protein
MKKIGVLMLGLGFFSACNNKATLDNKADSIGKKVDSFSKKVWDSGKRDVKDLKNKIENQFKKDSAGK